MASSDSLDPALLSQLEAARLHPLVGILAELGVEVSADLEDVEDGDLCRPGVTEIQRRRFHKLRAELLEQAGGRPCSAAPTTKTPAPASPCESRGIAPEEVSQTWREAPLPELPTTSGLVARRRPEIVVPYVSLSADGTAQLEREDEVFLREGQLNCSPERGWAWLRAKFPNHRDGGKLAPAVRAVERGGLEFRGRKYWLASTTKGSYGRGGVAWLASPPGSGKPQLLESALGFGTRLQLQRPTEVRPHPEFLLRARVKQLFSEVVATISTKDLDIALVNDVYDAQNRLRNDGAGEADPDVAEALAAVPFPEDDVALEEEDCGLCRRVLGSFQIRSGGLKGMLLSTERLRGTRRIEVPRNMNKFQEREQDVPWGPELGVISFSRVRPTALGIDALLRLEARGVPGEALVRLQAERLRKLAGALTRRRAFRLLRADEDAADPTASVVKGRAYFTSFVTMLLAGFDLQQHPLLSVIAKEQRSALEKAHREVRAPGTWAVRGHPEPSPFDDEPPQLRGNQVFFMYPCEDAEDGWQVLEGNAVINYVSDRDPAALRLAVGVDAPSLRKRCLPGVLYFSTHGREPPLQEGLSWDFDGDYFQVITDPTILEAFEEAHGALTRPDFDDRASPPTDSCKSLAGLQSFFLTAFPEKDHIGLFHYQWQMVAGEYPGAANTDEAKKLAAGYAASLDVEKGGPWPEVPRRKPKAKWDFMKNAGDHPRESATAAGQVFRLAQETLRRFDLRVRSAAGLRPDADLLRAWQNARGRLGAEALQALASLAGKVRKELNQRIAADIRRGEAEAADLNFGSQFQCQEKDVLFEDWLESFRDQVRVQASRHGASLEDVALAAWHLKYVEENAAASAEDPNPSFPWRIFYKELCEVKVQERPCCQLAWERHSRLLRRLQRAAVAAKGGSGSAARDGNASRKKLAEAVREVRSASLKCSDCNAAWERKRDALRLDGEAEDILEAMQGLAAGQVRSVPCKDLYYCKAEIEGCFRHGKQEGQRLSELVDKIVEDEWSGGREKVLKGLELGVVEYHGRLFVVEGNRRLWCVKKAEERLGRGLAVRVRVADVLLGWVRQQRTRRPASLFWEKYTTSNGGESVSFADDDDDGDGPETADPDESVDFRELFADPGLSEDELKALWKKLCMKHHPDKGGSTEAFQRLQAAYEETVKRSNSAGGAGQEGSSSTPSDSGSRPPSSSHKVPPQQSGPDGEADGLHRCRARMEQRCTQCRGDIRRGDMIAKRAVGWCHERCPSSQTFGRSAPSRPAPDLGPETGGIPARFEQACVQCPGRIRKGEFIRNTAAGWCHAACATTAAGTRPAEGGCSKACPRCGAGMKLRRNGFTQEQFWGCENFGRTDCRGTLPFS